MQDEHATSSAAYSLRDEVVRIRDQQTRWAISNSNAMIGLKLAGTVFAGIAAVTAVFQDIDKSFTSASAAISGAIFLLLQQLRFGERANAHYGYANDLTFLLAEMDWQTPSPIKSEELKSFAESYKNIVKRNNEVFSNINNYLGKSPNSEESTSTEKLRTQK